MEPELIITGNNSVRQNKITFVVANIIIASLGLVCGSFMQPLFSDRMSIEHRISILEDNTSTLIRERSEDKEEQRIWRLELNREIELIGQKIDRIK